MPGVAGTLPALLIGAACVLFRPLLSRSLRREPLIFWHMPAGSWQALRASLTGGIIAQRSSACVAAFTRLLPAF